jgi:cyclopropane fatty-acyl-phospholipid synthase-like methyltransferase
LLPGCAFVTTVDQLRDRLTLPEFPRSARYDPQWMLDNAMGPNPLWLAESLTAALRLEPGMRVLDLGCGRAITSIFLAREFDVRVVAADLWIKPSENWPRIVDAGEQHRVQPLHTEAHDLPFAEEHFDAIVSVDAYHYFGTDDLYLGYLRRFLRPGGQLGIAVPMLRAELTESTGVPEHLRPFWTWDWWSFHTADWWRWHWAKTGLVDVEVARLIPDGARHWLLWDEVRVETGSGPHPDIAAKDLAMTRADAGRTLALGLVVARRHAAA